MTQAVHWEHGRVTALGTLPAHASSAANDINDVGLVVGWSGPSAEEPHAILWDLRP